MISLSTAILENGEAGLPSTPPPGPGATQATPAGQPGAQLPPGCKVPGPIAAAGVGHLRIVRHLLVWERARGRIHGLMRHPKISSLASPHLPKAKAKASVGALEPPARREYI